MHKIHTYTYTNMHILHTYTNMHILHMHRHAHLTV
jgi:hypothetical protein